MLGYRIEFSAESFPIPKGSSSCFLRLLPTDPFRILHSRVIPKSNIDTDPLVTLLHHILISIPESMSQDAVINLAGDVLFCDLVSKILKSHNLGDQGAGQLDSEGFRLVSELEDYLSVLCGGMPREKVELTDLSDDFEPYKWAAW